MNKPAKRIYLCLAHMSEEGVEQKYIKKAFDDNYVVPMGPNVEQFEKDLEKFVNGIAGQARNDASRHAEQCHPGLRPGIDSASHPGGPDLFSHAGLDPASQDMHIPEQTVPDNRIHPK